MRTSAYQASRLDDVGRSNVFSLEPLLSSRYLTQMKIYLTRNGLPEAVSGTHMETEPSLNLHW